MARREIWLALSVVAVVGSAGGPASADSDLAPAVVSRLAQADTTMPHAGSMHGGGHEAADDFNMRAMYVAMGAMTGYMVAVMPVTTTAVAAAAGAGIATMWVYDWYLAPPPEGAAPRVE